MTSKRVMGIIPSGKDTRDYRLKTFSANFPEEYEALSTGIKDQGIVGSCAAHAAAEILEAHYYKQMSTDFIYGNGYNVCGTPGPGMKPRDVCKIVKEYGDCAWIYNQSNTEYNDVINIAKKALEDEDVRNNAALHRITSYARLYSINEIKQAIMNYGPVFTAIMWYSDNEVIDGVLRKGQVLEGGHAVILTGFNKKGFILQNSWGSRWGNNGKCILPYSYPIEECYTFIFEDAPLKKPIRKLNWLYKLINRLFK